MGRNSPSAKRYAEKQKVKEIESLESQYAKDILRLTIRAGVFQYNPFQGGKAHEMARILLVNGYLKKEIIKTGWWNLTITEKGLEKLNTKSATTTPNKD
jgi:hypothetical protein